MKDFYKAATFRDFQQRYVHSYGWCIIDGVRELVCIAAVGPERLKLYDTAGRSHLIPPDTPFAFEFIPADRGWYNSRRGHPLLFYRHPARQWSRGINASNTNVRTAAGHNVEIDLELMASVVWDKHEYDKDVPCAVSKQFMLGKNFVWFYDRKIGVITKSGVQVNKLFAQEMRDLFDRNKLPLIVEMF